MEVINAHGGQAGSHSGLSQQVLVKILLETGMKKANFDSLDDNSEKNQEIITMAEARSRKEYLV